MLRRIRIHEAAIELVDLCDQLVHATIALWVAASAFSAGVPAAGHAAVFVRNCKDYVFAVPAGVEVPPQSTVWTKVVEAGRS